MKGLLLKDSYMAVRLCRMFLLLDVVFHCFNPLQGDSVSSVGFYGCVGGVSLLQSLAG